MGWSSPLEDKAKRHSLARKIPFPLNAAESYRPITGRLNPVVAMVIWRVGVCGDESPRCVQTEDMLKVRGTNVQVGTKKRPVLQAFRNKAHD